MSRYCNICRNTSCLNHGTDTTLVGDDWGCNYIPAPTNADHIRAMSDEELAEFLSDFKDCAGDCLVGRGVKDCSGICATKETLKMWLQQPAEEDA